MDVWSVDLALNLTKAYASQSPKIVMILIAMAFVLNAKQTIISLRIGSVSFFLRYVVVSITMDNALDVRI